MKIKSYIVWAYAIILLIGGLMGYIMAGSLVSLFTSGAFAIALFITGYGIRRHHQAAYDTTIGIVACLFTFFGYRFFLTFQHTPAGLMTMLSLLVLAYLLATHPRMRRNSLNLKEDSVDESMIEPQD